MKAGKLIYVIEPERPKKLLISWLSLFNAIEALLWFNQLRLHNPSLFTRINTINTRSWTETTCTRKDFPQIDYALCTHAISKLCKNKQLIQFQIREQTFKINKKLKKIRIGDAGLRTRLILDDWGEVRLKTMVLSDGMLDYVALETNRRSFHWATDLHPTSSTTVKAKFSYISSLVRLFSLLFVQVLWLRPITFHIKFECRAKVCNRLIDEGFSPHVAHAHSKPPWPWSIKQNSRRQVENPKVE